MAGVVLSGLMVRYGDTGAHSYLIHLGVISLQHRQVGLSS
jgi:hypothetical protein